MVVDLLQNILLEKITSELYLQYKFCDKNSIKIPFELGQKIYDFYLTNNEYLDENDLNFFKNEITNLKDIYIIGCKYNYVKNFDFLNRHCISNLTINGRRTFTVNDPEFLFHVDHLYMKFPYNKTTNYDEKGNYFIDCITRESLRIDCSTGIEKIFWAVCHVFKNSSKHLKEIIFDVKLPKKFFQKFLRNLKEKNEIRKIKFHSFEKCIDDNRKEICQTYTLLECLQNSSNCLESMEFVDNFCFFHSIQLIRNFSQLKKLGLKFYFERENDQIKFLNFLLKYFNNNLIEINFNFVCNPIIIENVCYFLKYCHNLQNVYFNGRQIFSNKIYESLKASSKMIKKFYVCNTDEKCFSYMEFIETCQSLTDIIIGKDIINEPLSVIFKNSLDSISKIKFEDVKNLNNENILNIKHFIRNLKNLNEIELKFSQDVFEIILKDLKLFSNNLECFNFNCVFLNNVNIREFRDLICSCKNLKEIHLDARLQADDILISELFETKNFSIALKSLYIGAKDENQMKIFGKLLTNCYNLQKIYITGNENLRDYLFYILQGIKSSKFSLTNIGICNFYENDTFPNNLISFFKLFPLLKYLEIGRVYDIDLKEIVGEKDQDFSVWYAM